MKDKLKSHLMWLRGKSSGVRADFSNQDLRTQVKVLRDANLQGANLKGANLEDANLIGAKLEGADLRYANLRRANLRHANLKGADLTGADLKGAVLTHARLAGANLDFASLSLQCGTQFKADNEICKQLVAHTLRIMELSDEGSLELREMMRDYKKGWHEEDEF